MTKVLEELEATWREFVLHERAERAKETEEEVALRTSGRAEEWAKSNFYVQEETWRTRERHLQKLLEDLYERAEISDRERRLVQAGADTTCCCNAKSTAYAWCSVTWPR